MAKYIIDIASPNVRNEYIVYWTYDGLEAKRVSDLTPYTEPDLEQVRKEAYQQGYEQGYKDGYNEPGKGKIQVGDEVCPREAEYDDMIVTRLWKDDYDSDCIDAIGFDGRIGSFLVSRVSKTGKHYEIAEVLEKMREESNG